MHHATGTDQETHRIYPASRRTGGDAVSSAEILAEEVPVALVYNGISHAVMLATPADLEDFAIGFSLSECIVGRAGEVLDLEIIEGGSGIEVQMQITAERAQALKRHRRSLAGRTGCGLCGTESLDQLARRSARVESSTVLAEGAVARALSGLQASQALFRATGAVHAAAWCEADGRIELLREDVGRHNALDKMVGALARRGQRFDGGFVLMTSRASYEIVQKAATVGIAAIAALSAPTGMAVRLAEAAGVTLVGFARGHRHSVYTHPQRMH